MIVFGDQPAVYWDVDNTLIFSSEEFPDLERDNPGKFDVTFIGGRRWLLYLDHISMLADFKARGHSVVVWSAGGSAWAQKVIEACGIEDSVDLVIPKPAWYWDDKSADEWLPEDIRYYKSLKGFRHA